MSGYRGTSGHPAFDDRDFDVEKPPEVLEAERQPDNAANPVAVSTKKRLRAARDREMVAGLKTMLDTPNGRDWLTWLIFEVCHMDKTTENAAYDTGGIHYREGARSVGLLVQQHCVLANPAGYMALLQKHLVKDVEPK